MYAKKRTKEMKFFFYDVVHYMYRPEEITMKNLIFSVYGNNNLCILFYIVELLPNSNPGDRSSL